VQVHARKHTCTYTQASPTPPPPHPPTHPHHHTLIHTQHHTQAFFGGCCFEPCAARGRGGVPQAVVMGLLSGGLMHWDLNTSKMLALVSVAVTYVGLAKTKDIRCVYGVFGRDISKYTVVYGVYIYGSGQPYVFVPTWNTTSLTGTWRANSSEPGSAAHRAPTAQHVKHCVYIPSCALCRG